MSKENFDLSMKKLFGYEGGYNNNKYDKGGPTNLGVTQNTLNAYRNKHGLPYKYVKTITRSEAEKLYYDEYWIPSGADKVEDPGFALAVFDTSVLHGTGGAKKFLNKSEGDINKFLDLRKKSYDSIVADDPTQKRFYEGWNRRVDNLKETSNKLSKEYQAKNPDSNGKKSPPSTLPKPEEAESENPYNITLKARLDYDDYQGRDDYQDDEDLFDTYYGKEELDPYEQKERVLSDLMKPQNDKLQKLRDKLSGKSKSNSKSGKSKGKGSGATGTWVTINGAHVLLD